jgi:hypothetical protein
MAALLGGLYALGDRAHLLSFYIVEKAQQQRVSVRYELQQLEYCASTRQLAA